MKFIFHMDQWNLGDWVRSEDSPFLVVNDIFAISRWDREDERLPLGQSLSLILVYFFVVEPPTGFDFSSFFFLSFDFSNLPFGIDRFWLV